MKSENYIPKRMCVSCREMKEKEKLFRVVFSEGAIIDKEGKMQGRGAYVCKDLSCIAHAEKKKGFERAFKTACTGIYEKLKAECKL